MEQKRVNIYPRGPITTVVPPIRMPIHKVTKKIRDIRLAILAGAKVEEILADGSAFLLNINNYDKDNNINIKKAVNKTIVESAKPAQEANPMELPKESIREVEETPSSEDNAQKSVPESLHSDTVKIQSEEIEENKPVQQENLTRKQRRALEAEQRRKEQEAAKVDNDDTIVEVRDPEEGNV